MTGGPTQLAVARFISWLFILAMALLIAGLSMRRPLHVRNDVSALDPAVSLSLGPGGATFGLEF